MHQISFSLRYYTEMHGQQNIKNNFGRLQMWPLWAIFPSRATFEPVFQQMTHNLFWFTSRLKHPNIVQLLETFEDKHKVYLIMEL